MIRLSEVWTEVCTKSANELINVFFSRFQNRAMALLSNGASSMQITPPPGSSAQPNNDGNVDFNSNDHIFFSNLFSALPRWDAPGKVSSGPVTVPQR